MTKIVEKIVRCPRCRKECVYGEINPWRPFCSERCKLIDIGAWADESYRVPTEIQAEGESADELDDKS